MAYSTFKPIVTDGLVLNLDAANRRSFVSGSTVWNDLSGRGNTGTLTNGPTYSSANGGSIVFDGTDDYVNLGNNSTLSPSNITVSIWFKINNQNTSNNTQTVIRNRFYGYGIIIGTNLLYQTYVYNSVSATSSFTSPSNSLIFNTFYNLSFTFGNSLLKTYLNGVLINTSATAVSNIIFYDGGFGTNVGLGRDASNSTFYLNGNISNAQLYNRALSATEILQNYNALKNRYI